VIGLTVVLVVVATLLTVLAVWRAGLVGRLADWPAELTLTVAGYHLQQATPGGGVPFSLSRASVVSLRHADRVVVLDCDNRRTELVTLVRPWPAADLLLLEAWHAEGQPVALICHFDGRAEIHGPDGQVPVLLLS
jgi:hypothetical protein